MEENKAKIIISITDGKFEISGSENFVTTQIENFKVLITKSVSKIEAQPQPTNPKIQHIIPKVQKVDAVDSNSNSNNGLDKYQDVYVEDEDKLRIICDIPGTTISKKTLNGALLFTYGRKLQGQESANVEEIKSLCLNHGCLDKKNYSSHIKNGDPKLYIDKGSGKNRFLKLNRPGEKKAIEILKAIMDNVS